MVQAHGAVGGGGRAEVLEVGAVLVVQLRAQPGIQAADVGHVLHDLHADGGAEKLSLGPAGAFDLHQPMGLAALVGEEAELRHEAGDAAHELQHTAVAVAAGAQDGVGVDHGGGLRPAEDIALFWGVAHLIQIAGTGIGVIGGDAQLFQLLLIPVLLGVHDLAEDDVLQQTGGDVLIQGQGVSGEFLTAGKAGLDKTVVQVVDRLHHRQAEGDDGVAVLTGNGDHTLGAEGIAVHDQRLDHLGHGLALDAVQQGLLLGCQLHKTTSFVSEWCCAGSIVPVRRGKVNLTKGTRWGILQEKGRWQYAERAAVEGYGAGGGADGRRRISICG